MKLYRKSSELLVPLIIALTLISLIPQGLADSSSFSYQLLEHVSGSTHYGLNVIVPESLQEYYAAKSHALSNERDFAKFVTPYALQPIAASLREIYADNEDFANGALMIVHQITYQETAPPKYPVETMVTGQGDCDLFSFIVASIVKGGGLDVVLLYYEQEAHMNIGINLPTAPKDARGEVFYVTSGNTKYYVAECTGGNWQEGWRVGECPEGLKQANTQVITLENCEQTATGQVSASYRTLTTAALTLEISATFAVQGSTIVLSGQLSPTLQDKNITLYIRANNSPWTVLDTILTDSSGRFNYAWNIEAGGVCYIRASWSGDNDYSVTDSPVRTITSLSMFFVMLLVIVVILVAIGAAAFLMTRHSQQEVPEPQPPEVPYQRKSFYLMMMSDT